MLLFCLLALIVAIPYAVAITYVVRHDLERKRLNAQVEFQARLKHGEEWQDHVIDIWT